MSQRARLLPLGTGREAWPFRQRGRPRFIIYTCMGFISRVWESKGCNECHRLCRTSPGMGEERAGYRRVPHCPHTLVILCRPSSCQFDPLGMSLTHISLCHHRAGRA